MRPILFVWRGMAVPSYPVIIYASMLAAVLLTVLVAQGAGLDTDRSAVAVLILLVPGFIGARLFYVARHWDHFRAAPSRLWRRDEGGLSLHGGLIGILILAAPLLAVLGLPVAPFMDALVLGLIGALIIAKAACLLNGCCHGRPTAHWCSAYLPNEHGEWRRRFPSPLLEMAWAALVLLLMLALRNLSPPSGGLACAALALHPLGRIALQNLRDEGVRENAVVRKICAGLSATALLAGLSLWLSAKSSLN